MTAQQPRFHVLPYVLWASSAMLTGIAIVFLVVNGTARPVDAFGPPAADAVAYLAYLSFPTVGAAIAARQPHNLIGWLFLGAGLAGGLGEAALGYATYALLAAPDTLPGGAYASLVTSIVWWPAIAGTPLLLFMLFPTGRLLSGGWRWLGRIAVIDLMAYALGSAFTPGPLHYFPSISNPLGLGPAGGVVQRIAEVAGLAMVFLVVPSVVAVAVRFRRARGAERRQLAWLFYAGALWIGTLPIQFMLSGVDVLGISAGELLLDLVVLSIPIAVGVAILRHRLYDIEVVINRTLVYGASTLTLGAVYVGSVLLLQLALSPLTQESGLAVAGSTLAVAGLFRPLRSRIQTLVDRRFYRHRYDAARTLAAFGAHLRHELDLENLAADLQTVVRDTMQPTQISLWLRSADR